MAGGARASKFSGSLLSRVRRALAGCAGRRDPAAAGQLRRLPLSSLATTADGHTVESFTYRQLRRISDAVGAWLAPLRQSAAGVAGGARCAILAFNSPAWVATYLGIIASGNIAVPLDTAFTAAQVAKLLDDCGATLLFTDQRSLRRRPGGRRQSRRRCVAVVSSPCRCDCAGPLERLCRPAQSA